MDLAKLNTLINEAGVAVAEVSDALSRADIPAAAGALTHVGAALVGIQGLHDAAVNPSRYVIKQPSVAPLSGPLLTGMRSVQGSGGTDAYIAWQTAMTLAGYSEQQILDYVEAYGPGGQLRGSL